MYVWKVDLDTFNWLEIPVTATIVGATIGGSEGYQAGNAASAQIRVTNGGTPASTITTLNTSTPTTPEIPLIQQAVSTPQNNGNPQNNGPEIGSLENVGSPEGGSPENDGSPEGGSPENGGSPEDGSPENGGSPEGGSPENVGGPGASGSGNTRLEAGGGLIGGGEDGVEKQPPDRFTDVDPLSVHAPNIAALADAGITQGCGSEPLRYCPNSPVTRAQMASLLARALKLEPGSTNGFADVDPLSVHAPNIAALADAGITLGCGSEPLRYCPDSPVTRAQMASLLARALNL